MTNFVPLNVVKLIWLMVILPSSVWSWTAPTASQTRKMAHSSLSLSPSTDSSSEGISRREGLSTISSRLLLLLGGATGVATSKPMTAEARYLLDEETGEYVEVEDVDWQTAWKQRLDKAGSMSNEEIFEAARGAGNKVEGVEESPASRKRRALSACRNPTLREQAGLGSSSSEKDCTVRLLNGDEELTTKLLSR